MFPLPLEFDMGINAGSAALCPLRASLIVRPVQSQNAMVEGHWLSQPDMEPMGGKMVRTISQARADFAMTMMVPCYNVIGCTRKVGTFT